MHPDRFGSRNDLIVAYASFSPDFHYDSTEGIYVGGSFWDGRAKNIIEQAKEPFLNELEMANPDEEAVIEKIRSAGYVDLFNEVYGAKSLENIEEAYQFIAEAIADYECSSDFNKFSSKYDLYLDGKVSLTEQELRGLTLFEREDKGNCAACHPGKKGDDGSYPLLTDFTYDNIGVPKNPENPFYYLPKKLNPDGVNYVDLGLGGVVGKSEENGKFRVPTLRNLSKTGPFLHNGLFKTIREVVVFYNTRDVGPWPEPEVKENVNTEELGNLKLTELEVDDIVAFLKTLSDGYIPGSEK